MKYSLYENVDIVCFVLILCDNTIQHKNHDCSFGLFECDIQNSIIGYLICSRGKMFYNFTHSQIHI